MIRSLTFEIPVPARWSLRYRSSTPMPRIAARRIPELECVLPEEGWQVQIDGVQLRAPGALSLSVSGDGVDWFDLHGMRVAIPTRLAAPREPQGRRARVFARERKRHQGLTLSLRKGECS